MSAPDVVVIGGGIVGTATAAFLAEAGARVVLIERQAIAAGASGRNSGVVQHPFDPVLVELYRATLAEYRAIEAALGHGFHLPAQPAGLLYVGRNEDALRRLADDLREDRPEIGPQFLAPAEARALEPGLAPDVAAVSLAIGFPVAPAAATLACAELARRNGADVRLGGAAELVRAGRRVTGVVVDGEVMAAGAVVVAAGPWTPAIVDPSGAWRPIVPTWGVVIDVALAAAPTHILEEAEIAAAIEPEAGAGDAAGGAAPEACGGALKAGGALGFSLVTAGGRTSLGSTFLDAEPDPADWIEPLLARGAGYVPALADAGELGRRACARPQSRDGRPLIGAMARLDGAFVAAGHGPWGISTGPGSARLVADLVLGRRPAIPTALDPGRFGEP